MDQRRAQQYSFTVGMEAGVATLIPFRGELAADTADTIRTNLQRVGHEDPAIDRALLTGRIPTWAQDPQVEADNSPALVRLSQRAGLAEDLAVLHDAPIQDADLSGMTQQEVDDYYVALGRADLEQRAVDAGDLTHAYHPNNLGNVLQVDEQTGQYVHYTVAPTNLETITPPRLTVVPDLDEPAPVLKPKPQVSAEDSRLSQHERFFSDEPVPLSTRRRRAARYVGWTAASVAAGLGGAAAMMGVINSNLHLTEPLGGPKVSAGALPNPSEADDTSDQEIQQPDEKGKPKARTVTLRAEAFNGETAPSDYLKGTYWDLGASALQAVNDGERPSPKQVEKVANSMANQLGTLQPNLYDITLTEDKKGNPVAKIKVHKKKTN